MKIATFNVNSVRARLESLNFWLKKASPDVLLLQELKCVNEAFPYAFFEDFGYSCKIFGQKTYNGVAILAKTSIEDVTAGLPSFSEDLNARYIEAVIGGTIRVASLYIPNGGPAVGELSYIYKINFIEKLSEHFLKINTYDEAIFIGGDYNITSDNLDVYDEKKWHEHVCCTAQEREVFRNLRGDSFFDVYDAFSQKKGENYKKLQKKRPFTWWDYRSGSFAKNLGLRLDFFLTNKKGLDLVKDIAVDTTPRGRPKPSDHAPVILWI
ncbi:MAG: exodeoxyribonuclease III [Holosporales bacterium]|jgi:exodeoxyribonuclease-3|nr:exodeoxyribonuclease III [Holosporales bacterium]